MNREQAMEAFVEAEITEALRPYQGLPEELLEVFREEMRAFLLTHPTAVALAERVLPRDVPDESGKEDISAFAGMLNQQRKKAEGA